jgi:fatty acid-binding protein DegV
MTGVAIVTESTSCVRAALVRQHGIRVVPLQIVIGGVAYDEGGGPEGQEADSAKRRPAN